MKLAIVHYWLINMRGGEKVLELFCDIFPEADIFTIVYDPLAISDKINRHKITTSFIQRMPFGVKKYQQYVPLHPFAIEQFDLSNYDLVISSESGVAKGVILPPEVCHICYCHSPVRYIWNMYHEYRQELGAVKRVVWALVANFMRQWDYINAQRIDYFIANSHNVQRRIKKYFGRDSTVIYPPVDAHKFYYKATENFYLFVGQLNPYKRADLAVEAFNQTDKPLVIIGDGPQRRELEKKAGNNITFLGKQPDDVLIDHYSKCRGFIFPGEEDFGITPLEAMASGKPVIALAKGGALETVVDGKTGIFFDKPACPSLIQAIDRSEHVDWKPELIREHAMRFDAAVSREKLEKFIMEKYDNFIESL